MLAKLAWQARITPSDSIALPLLQKVCGELRARVGRLPDARSRQIIGDALWWAESHPAEISFNVPSKKDMLQVTPNVVGFQSVMHGIAGRLKSKGKKASRIVVDQQSQFNKAQKTLADFYRSLRGFKSPMGPGLPIVDHTHVPDVSIEFSSSMNSCGLELVDIHLWIFKRAMEGASLPVELRALVHAHMRRSRAEEISLQAIAHRWERWFKDLPVMHEMSAQQIALGQETLWIDEARRMQALLEG